MKKKCFKCGMTKNESEYYRHPEMGDGRLGKCKECTKKDVQNNYWARVDYYRAYDRKRNTDPRRIKDRMDYYKEYPKIRYAKNRVYDALKKGDMKKGVCAVCGSNEVQAHHDNYNKPLDIRWLCSHHHREWHTKNKPKGKN